MPWKPIKRPLRWSLSDLAITACAALAFILALIAACTGDNHG